MKKIIVFTFTSLLFNCSKNKTLKSYPKLSFSNIEKEYIFKNNIKKTFEIIGSDNWHYPKLDTIGIYQYNKNGNIKTSRKKAFMYNDLSAYEYDSLQRVIKKFFFTDYEAVFNFRYTYDSENSILKKHYIKPSTSISEEDYSKPAGIFKFDNKGLIYESLEYQNNDYGKGTKRISTFFYDSLNLLIKKETQFELSTINNLTRSSTNYYYTRKKIDSTISFFNWIDSNRTKQTYSSKTIFNKNGLKTMTIVMDSLITYYKHIKSLK